MNKALAIDTATLRNIPAVPYTKTWSPVHHAEVMDATDMVLAGLGIQPQYTKVETSKNGMDMFATINLPAEGKRDSLSIGVRNSMQRHFSLGFVGGHKVICCSNMCFYGEFVEHRRHTSGLTMEALHQFVSMAIGKTMETSVQMRGWYEELHQYRITYEERSVMMIEMFEQEILAPSKFREFQNAWDEELKDNPFAGVESMAHFHGAATRVLRTQSIASQQYRSIELNQLVARHIPKSQGATLIDRRVPMSMRLEN